MRSRIHQLFLDHAQALQVFFRRRIGGLRDTRDLTQEVYLRVLRASERQPIRNPEAYLFTVANHMLKERHVMQRREGRQVDVLDPLMQEAIEAQSQVADMSPEARLDRDVQRRALLALLPELPARTRLVLQLIFEEELTQREVAAQLGISKTMVVKILEQALHHCRTHMMEQESS
jgi:RNA polymerase sigma factor (sigma-70 family)